MSRSSALTTPALTDSPTPSGLPIASTGSPTRSFSASAHFIAGSGFLAVPLDHGEIDGRIGRQHLAERGAAAGEVHDDRERVGDHVLVGDDDAGGVDDE